jgi:hypothetical protein
MPRKRAPGGGRKPKGEFAGLSSPFSMRLTPDLRKKLDSSRRERGRSLAQEIMSRLNRSFSGKSEDWPDPATESLCFTIGLLARNCRFNPKMTWQTHPFMHEALKLAISKWLDRLTPKDDPSLPELEQYTAEQWATMIETQLWNRVQTLDLPDPDDVSETNRPADLLYMMSKVRHALKIPFDDKPSQLLWRSKKA